MIEEISKYILLPSNIFMFLFILLFVSVLLGRRKITIVICSICFSMYFILGSGPLSHYLLSKLEYKYSPFDITAIESNTDTIVILSGSAEIKPYTPSSSHINEASIFRLLETSHIHKLIPNSSIIISGYGNVPELMKQSLIHMGIPDNSIDLDIDSPSTYHSATHLSTRLSGKSFVMVTSAGHMPRSIGTFKAQGLKPIPAPTDYRSRKNIYAAQYLPTPLHWLNTDIALHEYTAIAWYQITNKM